jgi:hypothetical protein
MGRERRYATASAKRLFSGDTCRDLARIGSVCVTSGFCHHGSEPAVARV